MKYREWKEKDLVNLSGRNKGCFTCISDGFTNEFKFSFIHWFKYHRLEIVDDMVKIDNPFVDMLHVHYDELASLVKKEKQISRPRYNGNVEIPISEYNKFLNDILKFCGENYED